MLHLNKPIIYSTVKFVRIFFPQLFSRLISICYMCEKWKNSENWCIGMDSSIRFFQLNPWNLKWKVVKKQLAVATIIFLQASWSVEQTLFFSRRVSNFVGTWMWWKDLAKPVGICLLILWRIFFSHSVAHISISKSEK